MPKLQAYVCNSCKATYDYLSMGADDPAKCACGSLDGTILPGGRTLTTIIPAYPGSKRMKAGHVHTHGDMPAERGSVAVPRSFKGGVQ